MHWLWIFFLHKRQFTWLLMVVLIAAGLYAVTIIPKESAPEVIVPIGIVSTSYAGVPAPDIEELITNPLEDAIDGIPDLDSLTSNSRDGVSIITAQFDADADIDESIQNLKDAVDLGKIELPADASEPRVSEVNFQDQPILILAISIDVDPIALNRLAREVREELEAVSGVSRVTVDGVRGAEIQVVVKPEALLQYDVDIQAIQSALRGANVSYPLGVIETRDVEYTLRFEGDINDVSEIEHIPVATRGNSVVYIRDVAEVYDAVSRETTRSRVSMQGAPSLSAMTLSVYKRSGFDVTDLSRGVTEKLAEMRSEGGLLSDSEVLTVFDQGAYVKRDLSELISVGFETVLLVMLCLFLTIGWRESIVAALSIPLSFVIAFIGLVASGNTINFISLFSLILAIGILVDSGIVITEAIHTRMKKYGNPEAAAEAAIHEYAWPLIAGTMTTVAVFVPLFFLSGVVGEFISSIPYTIIFVLIASIIVALGMVPLIAIRLTKTAHTNRFEELQEAYTVRAQQWYKEKLVSFFHNVRAQKIFLWSLGIALVLSCTLPILGLLKVVFFPGDDVDYVYINIESVQGTPIAQTDLAVRAVEELLYDKDYIASFTTTVGASSAFTGSGGSSGGTLGNITVNLIPKEQRTLSDAAIVASLRESVASVRDVTVTVLEQQNGPQSSAPVYIKFIGDDSDAVARVVSDAETLLREIPGTTNVTASTKSNATEFVFTIDRDKARILGVSPSQVGEILRSAVFGITSTTFRRHGEDIDIVTKIAIDPEATDPTAIPKLTLDTLGGLRIDTAEGPVPLSSVVQTSLSAAASSISHEDRERVEHIAAYVTPETTAGEVVAAFQKKAASLSIPSQVRIAYGGEAEDVNESFIEMALALIAGLLLMLAILVLSFNSIRYSIYLLLAVPLSLIGVFGGLALTGQALSFTSLLGVIALAGVIINHAIILMDSMIHEVRVHQNSDLASAVGDAAVSRLRPIFLTTVTTVIGMIPLSTISSFWSPLAFAIMFGLAFAMVLTLVLVPTLFYRHEKRLREAITTH